ncbi:MAG: DUF2946 domain-containing protein [Meiothermus ruber]|jgi:hypothetical protein|uniref:DUF2946 domain-containing protein n=1 Tax=Meiothermus ruber TaxID=277 RepID=A0A7C3I161_MEIRU|nr:DUF2946 domain-containing protein [Meiothermus ruber]GIW39290.1 MAG: hypothetical protein KatS3mg075_771 [Meiothermus sp.]
MGARDRWVNQSIAVGLGLAALLVALLFGLRGVVMIHPEPVQMQAHGAAHPHGPDHSDHQAHCPLCFLQMPLPDLAPHLEGAWATSFVGLLWFTEQQARGEFFKAFGARGPPVG